MRLKIRRLAELPRDEYLRIVRKVTVWRVDPFNDAIVAIGADRLIGAWYFDVHRERAGVVIESLYTYVVRAARRAGVARRMWDYGIATWHPVRVDAVVGSAAGLRFLAHMTARNMRRGVEFNIDDDSVYRHMYDVAVAATRRARARRAPPSPPRPRMSAERIRSLAASVVH